MGGGGSAHIVYTVVQQRYSDKLINLLWGSGWRTAGSLEKGKVLGRGFKALGRAVVGGRRQEAAGRVGTGLVGGFKERKGWEGW